MIMSKDDIRVNVAHVDYSTDCVKKAGGVEVTAPSLTVTSPPNGRESLPSNLAYQSVGGFRYANWGKLPLQVSVAISPVASSAQPTHQRIDHRFG
jgi:hypothetical protein